MSTIKLKERIWGTLAHVPIITIIWISYVAYLYFYTDTFDGLDSTHFFNLSSPPLTPIIFTLLSLPILLSIMHFKKKSRFVYQNADNAYHFSLWLLKGYGIAFAIALIGMILKVKGITITGALLALLLSANCFYQCARGIIIALSGSIFCYWYPWGK